jgi:hypothetical protein
MNSAPVFKPEIWKNRSIGQIGGFGLKSISP